MRDFESLPFQHYSLGHRATAWVSTRLFDHATYTVRHGLLEGMRRKGGLGWMPAVFSPGAETAEHRFWRGIDLEGKIVYDIGAFHGLLTLYFASRAKAVVSFEPNAANHRRLVENLALNDIGNVRVRRIGLGSREEQRTMAASALMPGGATVDGKAAEGIRRGGAQTTMEEILIRTLDGEIARSGLPTPDWIKIDVEGWELEALRGAQETLERHRPALFIEMHGETLADKARRVAGIVDFLWKRGYQKIDHIESGSAISPENSRVALEGHLYCRGNQQSGR